MSQIFIMTWFSLTNGRSEFKLVIMGWISLDIMGGMKISSTLKYTMWQLMVKVSLLASSRARIMHAIKKKMKKQSWTVEKGFCEAPEEKICMYAATNLTKSKCFMDPPSILPNLTQKNIQTNKKPTRLIIKSFKFILQICFLNINIWLFASNYLCGVCP